MNTTENREKNLVKWIDDLPSAVEATLLPRHEWGFSNKMIDLTRHIDSVRKA
ncbi:MAG: hypothetical protein IJ594_09540 [Oscillospiraceae bacterium]|nr:hypothetical protein [Oscillospiraceae bacterium]